MPRRMPSDAAKKRRKKLVDYTGDPDMDATLNQESARAESKQRSGEAISQMTYEKPKPKREPFDPIKGTRNAVRKALGLTAMDDWDEVEAQVQDRKAKNRGARALNKRMGGGY